jgi:hypothetical protein
VKVNQTVPVVELMTKYFQVFRIPDVLAVVVLIFVDRVHQAMPDFVVSTINVYK